MNDANAKDTVAGGAALDVDFADRSFFVESLGKLVSLVRADRWRPTTAFVRVTEPLTAAPATRVGDVDGEVIWDITVSQNTVVASYFKWSVDGDYASPSFVRKINLLSDEVVVLPIAMKGEALEVDRFVGGSMSPGEVFAVCSRRDQRFRGGDSSEFIAKIDILSGDATFICNVDPLDVFTPY